MKRHADVLVIGGGIIGLSVAFRLRQAGVEVTLLERGLCGRESSWAGAGIIAPGNPHRSDSLYAIHCASLERYPEFCAELADVSGIDPQYVNCGALNLLTTEQFVQMAGSNIRVTADLRTAQGKPVLELLAPQQCAELEPNVTGECLAVLHCRRTAQVRNPRILQALQSACEKLGVVIHQHKMVTSLVLKGHRVIGVQCTDETFNAGHVVICAGAWSATIGPTSVGELIPVHPVRGQIVLVHMDQPPFAPIINKRHNYLVSRPDGHVLIGTTKEPEAGFDKRNTAHGVNQMITAAISMVPDLSDAQVVGMWAGLRPGTPDMRPHIGPIPGFEGLIAATGHYRIGLTLAPVTADIIKELIIDGRCAFDLSRCMPGRKPRGSS